MGIIGVAALLGFLFAKDGEKEDGAKLGAMGAAVFIGNM